VQRETSVSSPVTLLAAARSRHRGLRIVELEQFRGRAYVGIGVRWTLERDGEPVGPDDEPDDKPDDIAAEVYAAACEAKGDGDGRFRALFFSVSSSRGGELEKYESKFVVGDDAPTSSDAVDVEAQARADLVDELRSYVRQLHNMNIAQWKSITGIFESVSAVVEAPAKMLPRVLDLRMQAFEDRAAALGLVEETAAASDSSERMKESFAELKGLAQGPLGRAAIGRLIGLEGDDLREYVGISDGGSTPGESGIRSLLVELAGTLTDAQKSNLKTQLGAQRVELLITAATAVDERTAAGCVAKFFGEIDDAGLFGTLQGELTDEQQKLVARVMDELEAHTDDKS
jgi:hypothetical protein